MCVGKKVDEEEPFRFTKKRLERAVGTYAACC